MLDLHGVKHEEVQKILDGFIYENMMRKNSQITIITGNSSEMKRIVKDVVSEYGLTAVESITNTSQILIDLI